MFLLFSMLYIMLGGVGEWKINGVGSPPKDNSFLVKTFYKALIPNVDNSFPWKNN